MVSSRFCTPHAYRISMAGILALAAALPLSAGPALAASFTITGTSTTAQTLGNGETGTVTSSSTLAVGVDTVAVTITGNNATLTNEGTISQTGTGRVVRDNTGVTGLVINNNASALMQSTDADVIQMNKKKGSVTLNNYGTMTSLNASKGGAQAIDFAAIQSGSNVVNNYASGVIQAQDADAVRPGVNGVVNNHGQIRATSTTTAPSSDGIDAQSNTGVVINNHAGGSISGARHGVTGGPETDVSFTTTITNSGTISGNNGSGINLDGFSANQTATIVNSGTITGNGVSGDGDGIDVDGVVTITNTGTIRSLNAYSSPSSAPAQSEGITAGGGTITNSGTIEGLVASGNTNAVGRGITLAGVDTSGTPAPIYADSVITNENGGLIRGQLDSAIVVGGSASGHTVTIDNQAGAKIVGGGSNAAIRTGADSDTITNAGTIDGSSSGKAIDMGGGDNTLHIAGASASVLGDINGGSGGSNSMTIDPGTGSSFAYSGAIANFATVEVKSGIVTFSGKSSYTGTTLLTGGIFQLGGADLLDDESTLKLAGGVLEILNAVGSDAQSFASLALSKSSTIDLNGSGLTFGGLGFIGSGFDLSLTDYLGTTSLDYAFRLYGDFSTNSDFLSLLGRTTINGLAATYRIDGGYTEVSPVPEPATCALMATGLSLLAGVARRRKAKN